MHIGDVNLVTGRPVQTRYRHVVEQITPKRFIGRDAELAELAQFCTSPSTAGSYAWWRAKAWSGKSALMQRFVLNPPPGVRIVSFFITARLSSQNTRTAFIDNVLEQLLALLGMERPQFVRETTQEGLLLGLLAEAAKACKQRGEPFVLLVDGLDEDRSMHDHSIAALLPANPPDGMRVIVAGRPDPPIPHDVPADHPLRDNAIVRTLTQSAYARVVESEMKRDLKDQIVGAPDGSSPLGRDLLGLVTAAGGGLSSADLADLTGLLRWQVEDCLQTVTGRSFSKRGSEFQSGDADDVYLLAHEDLKDNALELFGPKNMEGYRDRLHHWAAQYESRDWPADTPEYLMIGYFRMVHEEGDNARMVACATDPVRQDRMLDLTAGDAIALDELLVVQKVVAGQEHPDLGVLVRLAIHRDRLLSRNSNIPTGLPAVWAMLGQQSRAESIIDSMSGAGDHVAAMVSLARVVATSDPDRAVRLVDRAESVARTVTNIEEQVQALTAIAETLADGGEHARAVELVDHAENVAHNHHGKAFDLAPSARVARAAAAVGKLDRAVTIAQRIFDSAEQKQALAAVAEAAAVAGQVDRATEIIGQIDAAASDGRLLSAVRVASVAGQLDRAERIAEDIDYPPAQAEALISVAEAATAAGEHDHAAGLVDRAEGLALAATDAPYGQAEALTAVAAAACAAGDHDRATRLINRAEATARANPRVHVWTLAPVATAVGNAGDLDRAEQMANAIAYPSERLDALVGVARAAAIADDLDRAERLARTITELQPLVEALTWVARAAAAAGELDRATELVDYTVNLAREFSSPLDDDALACVVRATASIGQLDRAVAIARPVRHIMFAMSDALTWLAEKAVTANRFDLAEDVARTLADPFQGSRPAFETVLCAIATAGGFDRVEAIARTISDSRTTALNHWHRLAESMVAPAIAAGQLDRAETIANAIHRDVAQVQALASIAEAMVATGDRDRAVELVVRAEGIARGITGTSWRALTSLVRAAIAIGQLDRAESVADTIDDPAEQAEALALVAEAVGAAGDRDRAEDLIIRAESVARGITSPASRSRALAPVVRAAIAGGRLENVERIAQGITETWTLCELANNADARLRTRLMARCLVVDQWQSCFHTLIKLWPELLAVITDELDTAPALNITRPRREIRWGS